MWRRSNVAALLAAVAVVAAACGSGGKGSSVTGSSSGNGPVTISLESYMPALGPAGVTELNSLVSGFQAANPNIHVKIISDTTSQASALSGAYQREAATNSLPDVGQLVFDTLRFAVQSLGAQDLNKTYGSDAVQALFGGPHPYSDAVSKLAVVDGKTYGIPWTLSTPVLFYNPTLFQRAGIDPSKAPATWDDVATDTAAIKSKTGADGINIACFGVAALGNDWCLQGIFGSNGGSVLNPDATATTFDSAANIQAVTKMQDIAAAGGMVDLTTAQSVQALSTGKLSMLITSSALQSSLLKTIGTSFTLKNGPMPAFAGKPATPTNSGSSLVVFSKDPAKQKAAWKLIQYLTNEASETSITTNIGYPPLRTSLASDPQYLKPFADKHPLIQANIEQLGRVSPWESYPGSNFGQIEAVLVNSVSKAIFQHADVASSLKSAQSQAAGLVR
jgi:multiple sugar transport system substrate-binding protein